MSGLFLKYKLDYNSRIKKQLENALIIGMSFFYLLLISDKK